MTAKTCDILMITHRRPRYTRLALRRLLETCDADMRVWLWHNGDDEETLRVADEHATHPNVARFHHSRQNVGLREPTNWLFEESTADFVSKVDDDCLMPDGWAETLRLAHAANPTFGVLGCWRFPDEEFHPDLARRKIHEFAGGHRLMRNCWVEGSGYLMKRSCLEENGLLREGESFPRYCIRLAGNGWVNGWYYPFLYQEHMDHPWSSHTMFRTDQDVIDYAPLVAQRCGIRTIDGLARHFKHEARYLQVATTNTRAYLGWRRRVRNAAWRGRNLYQRCVNRWREAGSRSGANGAVHSSAP